MLCRTSRKGNDDLLYIRSMEDGVFTLATHSPEYVLALQRLALAGILAFLEDGGLAHGMGRCATPRLTLLASASLQSSTCHP